MRRYSVFLLGIGLLFVFIVTGCATFRFAPAPTDLTTKIIYTPTEYNRDKGKYEEEGAPEDTRTRYRNKIVYSTVKEIDKNYMEFKKAFFGERAASETALDIAGIGLSTAGTLSGGNTVNILAAISTGLAGSRLSFNKNFFKEKSPDLLLSRMDALRAQQWAQMYIKLHKKDSEYSLYEAERDIFVYFEKGTLQAAFQSIIAESGSTKQKADDQIDPLKAIQEKYGEFMGSVASEAELKEVDGLYTQFKKQPQSNQESQADEIVKEFKKLQPDFPINPGVSQRSKVDDLAYIYSKARWRSGEVVRNALVAAFKVANENKK
jgi:hypothetical protein